MEREILFRGKRADNGEWMYGDLVLSAGYPGRAWLVESKTFVDKQIHGVGVREVDPATVGQYTGLDDRNGVKIFEGDILSRDCYDPSGRIVKVVWAVELAEFSAQTPSGYGFSMLPPTGKVIGNIHDNPELLGEMNDK